MDQNKDIPQTRAMVPGEERQQLLPEIPLDVFPHLFHNAFLHQSCIFCDTACASLDDLYNHYHANHSDKVFFPWHDFHPNF
ncbi:hypothetical protein HDU91_001166, partial [Kappamyces sp. JEL0680]